MDRDPGAELSAIESMVADWEHRGAERLARVKEVTDRVAELSATESSADGSVTVTVGANGLPTDIKLAESAKDRPMSELSADIMATLRKAQSRIPRLMADVAGQAGLAGDSVVAHLLTKAEESFPSPEPDKPKTPGADDDYFDDMRMFRDKGAK
ncbi:YbaB/EbfC family nucleoid-associated protein [Actinocrispum wychmicini]|uniref:YbaB/EbfC DNA-binding family protein n=1 Tax=Actinocrispum wychmicini TaxID=1213861 RepID=A0A4R2IXU7_9PSEU|nr:YbaB/EbfC family nucleoid-associated protein [Actinocrispum wychmicini]TCO50671.1 YbaB/EbfC DNA-binding family protein [Actinocrispum wychmicini]